MHYSTGLPNFHVPKLVIFTKSSPLIIITNLTRNSLVMEYFSSTLLTWFSVFNTIISQCTGILKSGYSSTITAYWRVHIPTWSNYTTTLDGTLLREKGWQIWDSHMTETSSVLTIKEQSLLPCNKLWTQSGNPLLLCLCITNYQL